MKQLFSIIIKFTGFLLLIYTAYLLTSILPMIIHELSRTFSFKGVTLLYLALPILCLLFFFYLSVYQTEAVLKFLKIDARIDDELVDGIQIEDEKHPVFLKEIMYKVGVFLIGFYLLAINLPNVILRVVQWLTKELSQVKGNSLDDLLNMVSPYNTDTLLYSLLYSVAGYLIVVNHSKITAYFLNKKETI